MVQISTSIIAAFVLSMLSTNAAPIPLGRGQEIRDFNKLDIRAPQGEGGSYSRVMDNSSHSKATNHQLRELETKHEARAAQAKTNTNFAKSLGVHHLASTSNE